MPLPFLATLLSEAIAAKSLVKDFTFRDDALPAAFVAADPAVESVPTAPNARTIPLDKAIARASPLVPSDIIASFTTRYPASQGGSVANARDATTDRACSSHADHRRKPPIARSRPHRGPGEQTGQVRPKPAHRPVTDGTPGPTIPSRIGGVVPSDFLGTQRKAARRRTKARSRAQKTTRNEERGNVEAFWFLPRRRRSRHRRDRGCRGHCLERQHEHPLGVDVGLTGLRVDVHGAGDGGACPRSGSGSRPRPGAGVGGRARRPRRDPRGHPRLGHRADRLPVRAGHGHGGARARVGVP